MHAAHETSPSWIQNSQWFHKHILNTAHMSCKRILITTNGSDYSFTWHLKWSQYCHFWGDIVLHRLADPPALSPHLRALGCHNSSYHSQTALPNPSEAKSMVQKRCWSRVKGFPAMPTCLSSFEPIGKGKKQFHLQVQGDVTWGASSLQMGTELNRNGWGLGP